MKTSTISFIAVAVLFAAQNLHAQSWSLTGNSGTNPPSNFIGTTDAHVLVFKVNNSKSGYLDYDASKANTGFGFKSLNVNTGSYNTAYGYQAMYSNTAGSYGTANGSSALYSNTIGNLNTADGYAALHYNTGGYNNTANGADALYFNTLGSYNLASGSSALYFNTTGNYNTANGVNALHSNTTGYSNVAVGISALFNNSTGHNLVAVGDSALYNQSTNGSGYYYNTAIGSKALFSNTTGSGNTATGSAALYSNTTGGGNIATGDNALYFNTSGKSNAAIGEGAMLRNTTGANNTAIGFDALQEDSSGTANTASGFMALGHSINGYSNTAIGVQALYENGYGFENTAVGAWSAAYADDDYLNPLSNATTIGYFAEPFGSNSVRLGNTSVTTIGGQVGWTSFSDGRYKKNIKEDVQGLSFINSLRPVTYTLDINSLNAYYNKKRKDTAEKTDTKEKEIMQQASDAASKIIYNGFVAQEVEAAAEKLHYNFSGVDKPKDKDGLYGLRYGDFVVPLVKAVQELSKIDDNKDAKIEAQQKQLDLLQKEVDDLKAMIQQVQQCTLCGQQSMQSSQASATSNVSQTIILSGASLEQNVPNPFTNATTIGYLLPTKFSSAQIVVTDKNGKTLKSFNIQTPGKGKLNVDASMLSSGAYNYALYVDGKFIDSKQMISAK
jgi:hypothetical protein